MSCTKWFWKGRAPAGVCASDAWRVLCGRRTRLRGLHPVDPHSESCTFRFALAGPTLPHSRGAPGWCQVGGREGGGRGGVDGDRAFPCSDFCDVESAESLGFMFGLSHLQSRSSRNSSPPSTVRAGEEMSLISRRAQRPIGPMILPFTKEGGKNLTVHMRTL